jgi:cbb3-type cytochrome oxidase maturation protein
LSLASQSSLNIFVSLKSKTEMSAIFILIGASIMVAGGFLIAFLWSVKQGQYDDDYTPSVRILFDNELNDSSSETK